MSRPFAVEAHGQLTAVDPESVLDAGQLEQAEVAANAWIKQLRHARVESVSFRDRFTHRGDSLWWFAELYLHKMRVVSRAHRAVAAFEQLAAERPAGRWLVDGSDHVTGLVAHLVARRHGLKCEGPVDRRRTVRRAGTHAKAAFHTISAMADRLRPQRPVRIDARVVVAAFVHSAFVGAEAGDETYVGPVLHELGRLVPTDAIRLVGLGPRTNFRVRRWRDRLAEFATPAGRAAGVAPVTAFANWRAIEPSRLVWRQRATTLEALAGSADLRQAAFVGGYDLWPLVLEELRGIADLQFPWSARAMDEAGAALDAMRPGVVVTYAEAGGWGRALMLEARRRQIPTVALQHGFIYRHWLNYQHAPDELLPSTGNPADRGFPHPDRTLVFDELTRDHLTSHARFPEASVEVTGSVRLDAIVAAARALDASSREALRARLGAGPDTPIALVVAKHSQLGEAFDALVAAARSMPTIRLIVKPHPAESAAPYLAASHGVANVAIAPPDLALGPLTAVASVVVTANSTAALEAMPLGVPALVVALPNNLSPFVDAGAMAGAGSSAEIAGTLRALLYDGEMRRRLKTAQETFMRRSRIEADGGAARRAADAIVRMART